MSNFNISQHSLTDYHNECIINLPNKTKHITKLHKKVLKGEIHTNDAWLDCKRHSIQGIPSITWIENKSRKDCLHDINITDLRDLLYHILGIKNQINNSFQVSLYQMYIFKICLQLH